MKTAVKFLCALGGIPLYLVFVWGCRPQAAPPTNGPPLVPATADVFKAMDGGVALSPEEI